MNLLDPLPLRLLHNHFYFSDFNFFVIFSPPIFKMVAEQMLDFLKALIAHFRDSSFFLFIYSKSTAASVKPSIIPQPAL